MKSLKRQFPKGQNGSAFLLILFITAMVTLMLVTTFSLTRFSRVITYTRSEYAVEVFSKMIQDAFAKGSLYRPDILFTLLTEAQLSDCPLINGQNLGEKKFTTSNGKILRFCFQPVVSQNIFFKFYPNDICVNPKSVEVNNSWHCLDLSPQKFLIHDLDPPVAKKINKTESLLASVFLISSAYASSVGPTLKLSPISHPLEAGCSQTDGSLDKKYFPRCLQVKYKICEIGLDGVLCSNKTSGDSVVSQTIILLN